MKLRPRPAAVPPAADDSSEAAGPRPERASARTGCGPADGAGVELAGPDAGRAAGLVVPARPRLLLRRPHPAIAYPCAYPSGFGKRLKLRYLGVDGPRSALAVASRQAFPVIAYTGSNGGGKTTAAVYDLLPTLAGKTWTCRNIGHRHTHAPGCTFRPDILRGCTCLLAGPLAAIGDWDPPLDDDDFAAWESEVAADVDGLLSDWDGPIPGRTTGYDLVWSTTPLLDVSGPRPRLHRLYRPLRSLRQLTMVEHGEVLGDEVQGLADARDHQSLPAQVRKMIYELRRRSVKFRWTAVDYSAADARLRQITQAVVYARGFDEVASTDGLWRPKTRFRWSTFDAAAFDQFTAGKRQDLQPLGVQHVYGPGHLVQSSFDTLAPVLSLSMASDSGVCADCGGSQTRDKCGCEHDPAALPPGIAVVLEGKVRQRMPAAQLEQRRRAEAAAAEQSGVDAVTQPAELNPAPAPRARAPRAPRRARAGPSS